MGTPERRAHVVRTIFKSYSDILGIAEGAARHVHVTRFTALILLVAVFLSQTYNPVALHAASYTNTWTSQGDFESDTAGSGGSTTRTNVDTTSSAGSVKLSKQNASDLSFSESFTSYNNIATSSISSAVDYSGNSITGTIIGSPQAVAGKVGQGLQFNGSNNYVSFNSSSLGVNSAYTISAWVNTNLANTDQAIFNHGFAGCCGSEFGTGIHFNGGASTYRFSAGQLGQAGIDGTTPTNTNTWYHVVSTFNGSTLRLYVNGAQENSADNFTVADQNNTSAIGARSDGSGSLLSGSLDDVYIYNRALSSSQVSALYNSGNGTLYEPGAAGYWTFDTADMPNGQVNDTSGNAHHASAVNMSTSTMYVTGKVGQALQFDGVDDYVDVGDPSNGSLDFGSATDFTLSAWIKPSGRGTLGIIDKRSSANDRGYILYQDGTTGLNAAVLGASGHDVNLVTGSAPVDTWTHVVATFTRTGSVAMYINGVFSSSTPISTVGDVSNTGKFIIGRGNVNALGSAILDFPGIIDDVRVYDYALSATEAARLYNSGAGTNISTPSLVGLWPFHNATDAVLYSGSLSFYPYGATTQTATSTVIDTMSGNIGYATLTANSTVGGGTVGYSLSNDGGTTWESVTPGVLHSFNSVGSSLKWKIALTGGASVQDITITYNGYNASGTVSNMVKDAAGDAVWSSVSWNGTTPSGTGIKFRTRGATQAEGAGALSGKAWSDYITTSGGAITANGPGGAVNPTYRYVEFELTLTSTNTGVTPTIDDFTVSYSINGPPDFNPSFASTGVRIFEIATSTDSNWGKVQIDYAIRDTDTLSGSFTPGYVTPTLQYNTGSGWNTITSGYLESGGLDNKAVSPSAYTTYTSYWDAKSQLGSSYASQTQVRVLLNDNELIYNTASATSSASVLDTTNPVASITINGRSATSTLSGTIHDDSLLQDYELSNNADFSADGSNAISGVWQTVSNASSTSISLPWTLSGTSSKTVYFRARDIYGNTNTSVLAAPPTPSSIEIHDLSNPLNNSYREFLAWEAYTSQTSATFSKYEVLRSTDGVSYSVLTNINNIEVNYYFDGTTASSTRYYYKVRTADTDGDSSGYTSVINDEPDGQGGSDNAAPNISNVVIDTVRNTSARVTWTTDELSNSTVNYGLTNLYGGNATSPSYATSHTVFLNSLLPNTTYYVRVRSTDIAGNIGEDDNGGSSYTFTTVGGPVISNVTVESVSDNSATVFWNTTTSADSFVYYSTNSNLSSPTQVGSATLVSATTSPYQHRVTLSGLTSGSTYYFYVKSTDGDGNEVSDDNNASYYSFVTTTDTTPPVISNISTPVISPSNVVVVWQTDELADSYVEFGTTASTTSGSYADSTTRDSTLSIYHVATLQSLDPDTVYYYRVQSRDAAFNRSISDESTFTTTKTGEVIIVTVGGGGGSSSSRSTTPPSISKVTVDPVNAFDATVNIETSPETVAFVQYGSGTSYTNVTGDSVVSSRKQIKIRSLLPGTAYRLMVKAIDKDGNTADSREVTFKTKFPTEALDNLNVLDQLADYGDKLDAIIQSALPSIFPPFIDSPKVANTTEDSATITWGTNVKSYSAVDYADDAYFKDKKDYETEISDVKEKVIEHSMDLVNLKPNTKYHVSAHAFIFPEVVGKSPDFTFVTRAAPIKAQILDVKNDSFRVVWTTDDLTSSIIEYKNKRTGLTNKVTDERLVKNHDIQVQDLAPGTSYEVTASGVNANGNTLVMEGLLSLTTGTDTTPPVVASLKIDSAMVPGRTDRVQSIVTWKSDEPATSVVSYEEGSGIADQPLKNKVEDTQGLVLNHVVILPNLTPGTIYRIQVASTDAAHNTLTLPVRTIVTPRQNESIVDIIFKNFSDTFQFVNNVR